MLKYIIGFFGDSRDYSLSKKTLIYLSKNNTESEHQYFITKKYNGMSMINMTKGNTFHQIGITLCIYYYEFFIWYYT